MRPNSCISSVTPCAVIPKDLKHFATNIDNDFIDFEGEERGPDVRNCCSELFFWNSTFLCYLSSLVVFCASGASLGGSRRCQAASKEVPRGQGKARPPERWRERSGRGLDDDFLIEAFSCQVWSFSVLLGRLQVAKPTLIPPLVGDLVVSSPGGCRRCRAASQEVSGGQGKPGALERWPKSSGRSLG